VGGGGINIAFLHDMISKAGFATAVHMSTKQSFEI
jgi:hypothetical protein